VPACLASAAKCARCPGCHGGAGEPLHVPPASCEDGVVHEVKVGDEVWVRVAKSEVVAVRAAAAAAAAV
jgi:hypothetical protein